MSKPKNMTPEQEAAWKAKNSAMKKAYYEANRENVLALQKAYYEANREKVLAQKKNWREANPEKLSAIYSANVEKLTSNYVATKLQIKVSEAPPELLELKREQIAMSRLVRKLNQAIDETNQENNHE